MKKYYKWQKRITNSSQHNSLNIASGNRPLAFKFKTPNLLQHDDTVQMEPQYVIINNKVLFITDVWKRNKIK